MDISGGSLDISGSVDIVVDEHGDENAQIITLIKNLKTLTPVQRGALIVRYKNVEASIHRRARRYAFFFHNGRFTVTVGSLLVPALISIQNSGLVSEAYVYWSAWIISLLVSICNGLISLIKIDKKYYFLYCVLEMLHTETWQYLALSGRYSDGCHGYADATHENQYVYFFHALERIKVKQVEEEYYKLTDMHTQTQARKKGSATAAAGLGVEKRADDESSEKGEGSVSGGDFEGINVPTPAPGSALASAQVQASVQSQVKSQDQAQKKNKVSIIEIGRR